MNTVAAPTNTTIDVRAIWALAVPAMITNVATALIGIGDVWIVGRLGDPAAQGAVDIGARMFALLFVAVNFLKTGTTGLVAQAGRRDGEAEQVAILLRALFIGAIAAIILLAAKPVLQPWLISLLGATGRVAQQADIYVGIRYWSAPAFFANLALVGYLVGQRRMRAVLVIEVAYNVLNVGLAWWLTLRLGFGIAGIGWSSFIAELAKLAITIGVISRTGSIADSLRNLAKASILSRERLLPFLAINRDLFLRTLILAACMAAVTRIGASQGAVILAANAIIFQLFVFTALLIDGFENAAQVLCGEAYGERSKSAFRGYMKAILKRGLVVGGLVSAVFVIASQPILQSFAATAEVASAAEAVSVWLIVFPLAGVASFVFDGVFVGASWTRELLLTMIGSTIVFAVSLWLLLPFGNGGLWASFAIFLFVRAVLQAALLPRLMRRSFA